MKLYEKYLDERKEREKIIFNEKGFKILKHPDGYELYYKNEFKGAWDDLKGLFNI